MDIAADLGVSNRPVSNNRVPNYGLPILDNERKRNGRSGLGALRRSGQPEDNLRLHAGRRILHADPHPCRVKLTIAG